MKKSTLITTIAMIVVVVVALSTATYAWFSTTEATYANIAITTQSDENLTVTLNAENIFATGENYATFSVSDFTTNAAADSKGIRGGIWVPNTTDALTIKPTSETSTTQCGISETALNFAGGIIDKNTSVVTINANTQMAPTLIHVKNNMASSKTVTLKIFVGYKNDTASRFAATGVSAYVASYGGLVAATKYNLPTTAAVTNSSTYAKSYFALQTPATLFDDSSSANHVDAITEEAIVAPAASGGGDAQLAYEAGLNGYDGFYVLSKTLEVYDLNEEHNYLTYVWLDAGYLHDDAKAAQIKIVYAFSAA